MPPIQFPVVVTEERTAIRQALIDWHGNRYFVPPELAAARVMVHQRLGAITINIATVPGIVIARSTAPTTVINLGAYETAAKNRNSLQ